MSRCLLQALQFSRFLLESYWEKSEEILHSRITNNRKRPTMNSQSKTNTPKTFDYTTITDRVKTAADGSTSDYNKTGPEFLTSFPKRDPFDI